MREHSGLSQAEVAAAADVSQASVSRAERGAVASLRLQVIDRIVVALGGSVSVEMRSPGGIAARLVDHVHAALVEHVVAMLRDWEVVLEFTFNHYGERGSVDILAWHGATRTLLIIEVKSTLTDLQALLAAMGRKLRILPDTVRRERNWDPLHVGRVIVVAGSTANRGIVEAHRSSFDVTFPARSNQIRRWLREPSGPIAGIWFVSTDSVPTLKTVGQHRRAARSHTRSSETGRGGTRVGDTAQGEAE